MLSYGIHLRDDYAGGGHEITPPRQPWQQAHAGAELPNCAQEGCAVIATHVGHVDPHGGQWSRFIQYENTQSLCARHHRQLKKRTACYCDS